MITTVRRVLVLGAAASLCAVAGCGGGDHQPVAGASSFATVPSSPSTSTTGNGHPAGAPPRVAWWSAGRLHLSDGVLRTPLRQVVARGGTTIVGRSTHGGSRWKVLGERRLVHLFSTTSPGSRPVLSADGRFVAWTTYQITHRYDDYRSDTTFTITAYDVGRRRVTGSTVIESRTTCCAGDGGIHVVGIDNDGTVLIARYADRAWAWRPGRPPVELTENVPTQRMSGDDQWPGGLSWSTPGDSAAVFARVTATGGAVTTMGRVPESQGLWSSDGTAFAYLPFSKTGDPRPLVWRDGHRQVFQAPRGSWPVAWESPGRVLLLDGNLDDPWIRVLRCRMDGTCEQAGPLLHHAHLPDPFVF